MLSYTAISTYATSSITMQIGDNNPHPGSQEWLWTHATYTPRTSAKAQECGKEALLGAIIPTGGVSLATWLAKGVFSVGSYGLSFGASFAYGYYTCLVK